ncbi:PO113 protein, partial [Circaetus pectoralis]|nr:PO113 protein [Circaetus pectoralis]
QNQEFEEKPIRSETPVDGLTVFTDARRKSKRAAVAWYENDQWHQQLLSGHAGDSLQTLELRAVLWVFQHWFDTPVNVVSDSLYVVRTTQRLEQAMIKQIKNPVLHMLLM